MADENKVILQTGLDLTGAAADSQKLISRISAIYAEVSKLGAGAKEKFKGSLSAIDQLVLKQERLFDLMKKSDASSPRFDKLKTSYEAVGKEIEIMQKKAADDAAFKKGSDAADTNAKKTKGIFSSLTGHISKELKQIGVAIAAAFTIHEIKRFAEESLKAFTDQEKTLTQLNIQITKIGGEGASAFGKLKKQAEDFQQTGIFSDDEIEKAQIMFAQFGLGSDSISKLIPTIIDFAAATGQTLDEATAAVLQGTEGMGRGLKKYGVTVDDTKTKQEKLVSITDQLNKKFAGTEKEISQTTSGVLQKLGNQFDEVKESVGGAIAKALTPFLEKVTLLFENFKNADFSPVTSAIKILTTGLTYLWKNAIVPVGSAISDVLLPIFNQMKRALDGTSNSAGIFQAAFWLVGKVINAVVSETLLLVKGVKYVLDLLGLIDAKQDEMDAKRSEMEKKNKDAADKRNEWIESIKDEAQQSAEGYKKAVEEIENQNKILKASIDEITQAQIKLFEKGRQETTIKNPLTGDSFTVNSITSSNELLAKIKEVMQANEDLKKSLTAPSKDHTLGSELQSDSDKLKDAAGSLNYYQNIVDELTKKLKATNLTTDEARKLSDELAGAQTNLNDATEKYNALAGIKQELEKNDTDLLKTLSDEIDRSFNYMRVELQKQFSAGAINYEQYQLSLTNIDYLNTKARLETQIKYYKSIAALQLALGQDISESLNEIAKLEADLSANEIDYARKTREAVAEIYRTMAKDAAKAADDSKDTWQDHLKKVADTIDTVAQANITAAQDILSYYQQTNDEIIKLHEHRVDEVTKIAGRGNAELLQLEQHRLDEAYKKQAKFVRDQQALNLILSASNMVVAISKAVAEGGGIGSVFTVIAAIASFVGGILAAKQALQAAQSGFYSGGSSHDESGYTGEGNPKEESRRVGKKPYKYHKEEFIFNHEHTKKYRKIFEDIHKNKIDLNEIVQRGAVPTPDKVTLLPTEIFNSERNRQLASASLNHDKIHSAIIVKTETDKEMTELNRNIKKLVALTAEQERLAVSIDESGIHSIVTKFQGKQELARKLANR